MKRIIISLINLALIFSLAVPPVSAQGGDDPDLRAAELAEHVPGEVLIRFLPGIDSSEAADRMNEMGAAHKREIPAIGIHVAKLPQGLSVEEAIVRFSRRPGVEFVEPNYIIHIAETLQTEIVDQWGFTKINTEQAWNTLSASQKNATLLATVDTGIKRDASDLSPSIWTNPDEAPNNGIDNDGNGYVDDTWGWDFVNNDNNPADDHMHGSAVTSVMTAARDGAGVVGICPWCKVMAVKVLDSQGSGNLDVVASGIVYAAQNGARVINLSLAGSVGSQTLESAVNFAWNQGSVVVAAAGNDGQKLTLYPAGYANAISVASTNPADKHSCFSNYNTGYISVAAPGEAIYVLDITNSATGYNYYSGTSLSTPHVAGLAGLILGKDPNLSNVQVRSILENSAIDLGSSGVDAAFGFGRIDAFRAITGDFSTVAPPDGLSSASDTATGYAHTRKLVRDNAGKLHLIWHTDTGSLYRIRYATSVDNGATWTLQPDVFSSPYETYHPALAADNIYLYAAIPSRGGINSPYQILFTRKPLTGGSWSAPVSLVGGTFNAVRPDIYVDPTNGRLHVIASSLDDAPYLYYRASTNQGAGWGSLSQFNPSKSTSNTRYASVYANGDNVYIATRTVSNQLFFTYYYLYTARSTNGGVTWTDQTQISSFLALLSGEYGVSLAGVGDRLYMGYEVGSNLYFRRNDGAGWSNYLQLETGDANNVYKWPSITQANDGQAWMTFEVNGQLYMRHYDGATWQPKQSIGTGYYANLKRGTAGNKVEWVSTNCNGSPFDLAYGSLSIGNPPPNTPTATLTRTPTLVNSNTPTRTNTPTGTPIPFTATNTAMFTPTNTGKGTAAPPNTPTRTNTPTGTPIPFTATNTAMFTPTNTGKGTAAPPNTPTRTNTPINTSTRTNTPGTTATFTPTNSATATATAGSSTFPSTGVLDTFNRANGGIGTNWSGYPTAFTISSNQLDVVSNGSNTYILWNGASFGSDQEVHIKLAQNDTVSSNEQSLILKSQSSKSTGSGLIDIRYDGLGQTVRVWTYHPTQGWVQHGANIPATFVNGDQFGARARADGTVEIYKNGVLIGTRSITSWPYYANSGYIGLWFVNSPNAVLDDFGGGTRPP